MKGILKKIGVVIFSVLFLFSCAGENRKFDENKIKISTSIIPLASIANHIGGDKVSVVSTIKKGTSPHNFDLKPEDIVNIQKADIVVYTGFGLDNFFDKNIKPKQKVITMREFSVKREVREGAEHNHNTENHVLDNTGEDFDEHKNYDPHVWLSPMNAKFLAREVKESLIKKDEKNKQYYEDNYLDFQDKINELLNDFYDFQEGKNQDYFIILHDGFEYLFYEIGVDKDKQLVIRKTPGVEITIKDFLQIKKIINNEKDKTVGAIFKEPEFDSKAIASLEENYNIPIRSMSPLGDSENKGGYIDNLRKNLEALKTIYHSEETQEK
ncbi:MAG: metal ABC transporter substrate-binding protein [Candidatus Gracilibacteria bacterium]|nr:metal ABC transporter substrate-binding protein [Candidatus Gracilibacteria bacterium]